MTITADPSVLEFTDLEKEFDSEVACDVDDCAGPGAWIVTHKDAQPQCTQIFCDDHRNALKEYLDTAHHFCEKHPNAQAKFDCRKCNIPAFDREDIIFRRI